MTKRPGALHMSPMTDLSTRARPASASNALIPLADVMRRLAGRIAPAHASRPSRGTGPALQDHPARDVAARTGFACSSADLVGATPQSPAFLPAAPVFLFPGDALPAGCDCVLPGDAFDDLGGMPAATASAHPGEGVRRRGEEARAGEPVPEAFDAEADAVGALASLAASFGIAPSALLESAEAQSGPGIALTGCFEIEATEHGFRIPARLPSLVPFLCGVLLPLADRAAARPPAPRGLPLARRVVSSVGVADLVLLRAVEGRFEPLAAGVVPLSALARATHRAVLPPESEGLAEGAFIEAVPL